MAQPSFPQYHTTGAVFHFIRTPSSGGIYFLGTCEMQPDVRVDELSMGVKNDETGKMLDGQKTDQGERADIAMMLTRYSEQAYGYLRTPRGTNNGLQIALGIQGRFARGSMVFGSKTFELWQVFENSLNPAFRQQQPLGRYWPQVELMSHAPAKLGTQEKVLLLVCEAQPWRVPQASINQVTGIERSHVLYQEDDAAFPNDVLTPQ